VRRDWLTWEEHVRGGLDLVELGGGCVWGALDFLRTHIYIYVVILIMKD